ncbi:SDR family NAD(P)-dependent oxidoreductase [Nocardia tengchongensis]|uniref:SDR family NAD(P)-dependent oxidoreductase n=1 Tax=Nocardia tengchongensis TaxID=2055889 RepID=UPI0036A82D81
MSSAPTEYGATTETGDVIAGLDLAGRVAVVTGATAGLGAETARALAAAGATVILAARDVVAAAAVADRIRGRHPRAELDVVPLDLGSLESVRAAVRTLCAARRPLHLLINNAGVMYTPFGHTADGFESQFGTNHLGHFALSAGLLPALSAGAERAGEPSRVVTVSSAAHHAYPADLDDPNFERREYDKFASYGQSKAANVLMTVELAARGADGGVHAYAVHPGTCATDLARHMSRADFIRMRELSSGDPGVLNNLKSVPAAAATTVWAATSKVPHSGAYLADCGVAQASSHATDPATAAALWELSERLTAR